MIKISCGKHDVVWYEGDPEKFDQSKHFCPECEESRNKYIQELRDEGWTDSDFEQSGWRDFKKANI